MGDSQKADSRPRLGHHQAWGAGYRGWCGSVYCVLHWKPLPKSLHPGTCCCADPTSSSLCTQQTHITRAPVALFSHSRHLSATRLWPQAVYLPSDDAAVAARLGKTRKPCTSGIAATKEQLAAAAALKSDKWPTLVPFTPLKPGCVRCEGAHSACQHSGCGATLAFPCFVCIVVVLCWLRACSIPSCLTHAT